MKENAPPAPKENAPPAPKAKRFVGFGFGPIQTGLMLCEAAASGSFSEYAVAEVDAGLVQAVRDNGNAVSINIARQYGVSTVRLSGIRLLNPRVASDRSALVEAIAQADEMATAIPSVSFYSAGGDASIAALIAEGAGPDKPRVIYTAENNNFAAEILRDEVLKRAPATRFARLQFLNTVVGKMSGVISSAEEMGRLGLAPLVPGFEKCVLVEEFNRIYISKITLPGFSRGIRVFEEKEDLLPFEEAKLFGHNAIHALLGYLASARGLTVMSEIRGDAALMALGRRAFIEESGAALIRKHGSLGDPLFTENGYAAYADDLLARMTNPFLNDRVERIIRDPRRKLGYGDRLFGTMREALRQGIRPITMARGAAAAVTYAMREEMRLRHREEMRLRHREEMCLRHREEMRLRHREEMRLRHREEMRLGPREESEKPAAVRQWLLDLWAAEKADEYREECLGMVLESLAG